MIEDEWKKKKKSFTFHMLSSALHEKGQSYEAVCKGHEYWWHPPRAKCILDNGLYLK